MILNFPDKGNESLRAYNERYRFDSCNNIYIIDKILLFFDRWQFSVQYAIDIIFYQ